LTDEKVYLLFSLVRGDEIAQYRPTWSIFFGASSRAFRGWAVLPDRKPAHIGDMTFLLALFILVACATTAFDLVLRARQAAYVARHRDAVPPDFAHEVSLAEHQRAADYEQARLRLGSASALFGLAAALAWAIFGYDTLYGAIAALIPPGLPRSVLFLIMVGVVSSVLSLPFALLRTFGVEQRFGFNRTTPGGFALDRLKSAALSLGLAAPLLFGLMWLMRQPGYWWVWAWLGFVLLMLGMMHAYPRWIAPLFNRFTPLEDPLRERIENLLQRCGFRASGLFVVDASRRSAHGNAYFSGLGRSKRIVLFDTLIAGNSEAELEAVLAHELGHFRLNHVLIGVLQTAALLFLAFFAIGFLGKQPWLLPSFGIVHRDDALALVVCVLVVQMAGPVVGIAGNWISRRHEYQADDFARRMVGAEPLVSALVRLSRDNASTLTTDPLYALVNFSHPPLPLRVQRLRQGRPPAR
jgi:STE24 endopeptidase